MQDASLGLKICGQNHVQFAKRNTWVGLALISPSVQACIGGDPRFNAGLRRNFSLPGLASTFFACPFFRCQCQTYWNGSWASMFNRFASVTCHQDISRDIKPEYQDIDGDGVTARQNGDEVNTKWQQIWVNKTRLPNLSQAVRIKFGFVTFHQPICWTPPTTKSNALKHLKPSTRKT